MHRNCLLSLHAYSLHWTKNEISYMQEICRIGLNPLHISFIRMTFSPYPLLEMRRNARFWKTGHVGNFIFGSVLIVTDHLRVDS